MLHTGSADDPDASLLRYLSALTFDFHRGGRQTSCVLIYAEQDPERPEVYHPVVAQDTGYEGIACVDDTARAALLALDIYDRSGSATALNLAERWLTFVDYMQYPDGSFANFIRNGAGVRNANGATSVKGGYWWSVRALWALARAYRVTGRSEYRESYLSCRLAPTVDGKLNAVLALAEMELYQVDPSSVLRESILQRCNIIAGPKDNKYFRDQLETNVVHLWGYHQLHAVASASRLLGEPGLLDGCYRTIKHLIEPDIRAYIWYSYPARQKDGVCAYTVAPIVQGLGAMYRATGTESFRTLGLEAAEWFYGRNDAHTRMYDPSTGRCRDGINRGVASKNCGAESSIEAGFAEMERQSLLEVR